MNLDNRLSPGDCQTTIQTAILKHQSNHAPIGLDRC